MTQTLSTPKPRPAPPTGPTLGDVQHIVIEGASWELYEMLLRDSLRARFYVQCLGSCQPFLNVIKVDRRNQLLSIARIIAPPRHQLLKKSHISRRPQLA